MESILIYIVDNLTFNNYFKNALHFIPKKSIYHISYEIKIYYDILTYVYLSKILIKQYRNTYELNKIVTVKIIKITEYNSRNQ